jgi:type IV pilus assembly protein PilA
MNLRHARRAQAGFTLIELMIVVVIIGILSAIAIPQYQAYTVRTQVTRAIAEAGALKTGVDTCLLDGKTTVGPETADTPLNCDPNATGSTILKHGAGTDEAPAPADGMDQVGNALPSKAMAVPEVALLAADPQNPTGPTATITATFGNSAASYLKPTTPLAVVWTRDVRGTWTCATSSGMDPKYTPPSCPPAAAGN